MTTVARPRNNLQQHLSWFIAEKPQLPSRGSTVDYSRISSEQPIPLQSQATQPVQPLRTVQPTFSTSAQGAVEMPTPASMRSSTLAAPQRSEVKDNRRDNSTKLMSNAKPVGPSTNHTIGDVKTTGIQSKFLLYVLTSSRFHNTAERADYHRDIDWRNH